MNGNNLAFFSIYHYNYCDWIILHAHIFLILLTTCKSSLLVKVLGASYQDGHQDIKRLYNSYRWTKVNAFFFHSAWISAWLGEQWWVVLGKLIEWIQFVLPPYQNHHDHVHDKAVNWRWMNSWNIQSFSSGQVIRTRSLIAVSLCAVICSPLYAKRPSVSATML